MRLDVSQTDIASNQQIAMLRSMKLIRSVEETIAERYPEQNMRCPTHLSVGQEAVASGVCAALQEEDQAYSGHRAHAHYLAKGGNVDAMIAEIYGKSTGCSGGIGGSMHLVDLRVGFLGSTAIVAGTIPLAVGTALSNKVLGRNRIACAFFGDAAVEEGVFSEAANFAVVKQLPVLFICENNLYSVYSPLRVRQPPERSIATMVAGIGMHTFDGDGNDVEAVYHATRAACLHIQEHGGPVFLEFFTYRWREHCGPEYDNDLGYRTREEYETWKARDPILAYEETLISGDVLCRADIDAMNETVQAETDGAFAFAEQSADPDPGDMPDYVYADTPESA